MSQKKTPLDESLNATNFGARSKIGEIEPDSMVSLTIDKIVAYDNNPRKDRNPEYDMIKASVASRGVEQTIGVTQRPDMPLDEFMIASGGNTRLAILKELYEETGDTRYFNIQCKFVAWNNESDTLVSHLVENDARGDYRYVDRVGAVMMAKSLLEDDLKTRLAEKNLIKELMDRGYKLSRKNLQRFQYTYDHLVNFIPEVLNEGMGPRQADQIQKLHVAAKTLFEKINSGDATFDDIFHQILKSADGFDFDGLYKETFNKVANEIVFGDANKLSLARYQLEALMEGRSLDELYSEEQYQDKENDDESSVVMPNISNAQGNTLSEPSMPQTRDNRTLAPTAAIPMPSEPVEPKETTVAEENKEKLTKQNDPWYQDLGNPPTFYAYYNERDKIKNLRYHLYRNANDLSHAFGMGGVIADVINTKIGAGYYVRDFPKLTEANLYEITNKYPRLANLELAERKEFFTELFWHLISASGVYSMNNEIRKFTQVPNDYMPAESVLARLQLTGDFEAYADVASSYMSVNNTASSRQHLFFSALEDEHFKMVMEMNIYYRELTKIINIWEKK